MSLLVPNVEAIPVPRPTADSESYWNGCRAGELRYLRCNACDAPVFEPRPICPRCHHRELRWERSEGLGSVYSWSIVWRPQTPAFTVPYAPAVIRLDEGFDMVSAIIGCEPDAIHADQRVRVEFHSVDEVITLPFFVPT